VLAAAPASTSALYEAAVAHEAAGQGARALELFDRYLVAAGPAPAEAARVTEANGRRQRLLPAATPKRSR